MTDTDDLERKINFALENIELQTEKRFLTAGIDLAYLLGGKEYNEIIKCAQKLIEEDPKNYFAFYYFGRALHAQGKYTQAIEALNKAIDLRQRPEFYYARGGAHMRAMEWNSGDRDFQEAGKIDPQRFPYSKAEMSFRQGRVWDYKGNLEKAIEKYEQALKLKPDYEMAADSLSKARKSKGRRQLIKKVSWNLVGAGLLVIGALSYFFLPSTEKPLEGVPILSAPLEADKQAKADRSMREPRLPSEADSQEPEYSFANLHAFEFEKPIYFKFIGGEQVLVYEAGKRTLHYFGDSHCHVRYEYPGITVGEEAAQLYGKEYDINSRREGCLPFKDDGPSVDVDNLDGTSTRYFLRKGEHCAFNFGKRYKIPKNQFEKRHCRQIVDSSLAEYIAAMKRMSSGKRYSEQTFENVLENLLQKLRYEMPTHYTLLNDEPSKFEASFGLVLPLRDYPFKRNGGRCSASPVAAFNNTERAIIVGDLCEDGTIELQKKIPYFALDKSTQETISIIDYTSHATDLYYLRQGSSRIEAIHFDAIPWTTECREGDETCNWMKDIRYDSSQPPFKISYVFHEQKEQHAPKRKTAQVPSEPDPNDSIRVKPAERPRRPAESGDEPEQGERTPRKGDTSELKDLTKALREYDMR